MNEQLRNFGRNVIFHMTDQKLAASSLAKRAGISPKTLNNILNSRHSPQLDVLAKVADALKVELWQLWLPDMPADLAHDETFPRLVKTAAR
jgi:transcriptional regulator with XRE-family HTH domain